MQLVLFSLWRKDGGRKKFLQNRAIHRGMRWGRQRKKRTGLEEMEHRPYRPVLSRGQARMPTLPVQASPVRARGQARMLAATYATLGEMFQREAGGVKKVFFTKQSQQVF